VNFYPTNVQGTSDTKAALASVGWPACLWLFQSANFGGSVVGSVFNLFDRWRQHLWFKTWAVWGDRVGL